MAEDNGGVIYANEDSLVEMKNGTFRENVYAHNGGVVYIDADSQVLVRGGTFSANIADNGGGVFYAHEISTFEVGAARRSD